MQAGLEERKKKKKKEKGEAFRVLRDQIEMWAERELEDCNVEGSLKGGKKCWSLQVLHEKTESLKAIHLLALSFHSNSCLSDFLPPFIPFHTVYKYWQNLPALVKVSLHLNSFFWVQNFYALFILIWDPFFSFVCVCVYINLSNYILLKVKA